MKNQNKRAIKKGIPGIDYSAAVLYNIASYGNFGFEIIKPDSTAEVFNYSKDRNTNYWYAVTWAEKHTPQLDYINVYGPEALYPRDTVIYELIKAEFYTYTMLNRPAGYGTCPDGRIVDRDQYNTPSMAHERYGSVTYTRKLTPAELYKWEMRPESDNAYQFQIGDRVIVRDIDPATVIEHRLGRSLVKFDYTGVPAEYMREDDLTLDDRPIQGCDEPEPRDSQGYTAACDPLYLKGEDAIATPEPRISDTTDWPAFDLDYLPGVIQYDRAVADSGYHGSYRSGIMEPGRPMSSYDQLYTATDPHVAIASLDTAQNQDHLKFWHCDFCHKGLTARDLHDITDHKIRCWDCFDKQQDNPLPPKPAQLSLF